MSAPGRGRTGADGLAAALRAEADVIFGVMGHATAEVIVRYVQLGGRFVATRHESSGVGAADGYSRLAGRVGVATVTCGPGITQVGTAMVTARRADTPVVLLAGDLPWTDRADHQHAFDQARFAEAIEAAYVPIGSVAGLAGDVRQAFHLAANERRTVVLDATTTVQAAALGEDWAYVPAPVARDQRIVPDPDSMTAVAGLLAEARRPVILAGRGARDPAAREALLELADACGALLATTMPAKGLFGGHPWNVGVSGGYSSRIGDDLLANADLVLAFGTSLHRHTTRDGRTYAGAQIVRIDTRPGPARAGAPGEVYVRGDAAATARALLADRRAAGTPDGVGYRTADTRAALSEGAWTPPPAPLDGLDPRSVMAALDATLPARSIVVVGGGHGGGFPVQYLNGAPDGGFLFTNAFGAIGQTLGAAIGAAIAAPDRRIVVVDGDGSVMMHLQELDTMARLGVDVSVIVMDDAAYGAELHQLRAHGLPNDSAIFADRSYASIGQALGVPGIRVESMDELPEALGRATTAPGPFLVDVAISRDVITDHYRRLHFGGPNEAPHLTGPRHLG